MKSLSVSIFVALIVVALGLYLISFQVRETEVALVTKFGKPIRTLTEPNLYWKWPAPINTVHKFDSRNHLYEGLQEETTTKGGDPIIVTSYIVWKIDDPLKFLESVRDARGAEDQLKSLLRDTQNSVIGRHYFSEFVNSDPSKIKFVEIETEMFDTLKTLALTNYGIAVRMVGIKQLGVNEAVTEDVFNRMKADRQRKIDEILADGNAEAMRIRDLADAKAAELLAVAQAQAKAVRGKGDAEAAGYYKLLDADPELAMFLRDIEALREILREKSTIILGAETEPMQLLRKIPDIKPKQ